VDIISSLQKCNKITIKAINPSVGLEIFEVVKGVL
jgi:hypothetical protein